MPEKVDTASYPAYPAVLLGNLAEYLAKVAGDPVRMAIWLDLHDMKPTADPASVLAAIAQDFSAAAVRERERL